MGYDPIFKQQPGPAQIQPAPSTAPLPNSIPASAPPSSMPYAHVPQGYAPAATAGYAPPTGGAGPHPPYDSFNSAIDPALAAADPAMQGAPYNGSQTLPPAFRTALGSASPYSSTASDGQPLKAKRIKISDLFPTNGHKPPEIPARLSPITPDQDAELTNVYTKDYCPGIDALLETHWFSTNNNGLNRILGDKDLHEEIAYFVETCKYSNSGYDMAKIPSQEARLIWHMLSVCRQSPPATNGTNGTAPVKEEVQSEIKEEADDLSLKEVRARLEILEALLTNANVDPNPLLLLTYPADLSEQKMAEVEFWKQMGDFVAFAEKDATAVEIALGAMRGLLQQIETRDVLYSVAIARVSGSRVPGFPNNIPMSVNNNPNDEINKLNIAMRFIQDESRASSQQVITRICDMALTSWAVGR